MSSEFSEMMGKKTLIVVSIERRKKKAKFNARNSYRMFEREKMLLKSVLMLLMRFVTIMTILLFDRGFFLYFVHLFRFNNWITSWFNGICRCCCRPNNKKKLYSHHITWCFTFKFSQFFLFRSVCHTSLPLLSCLTQLL